MEGEYVSNYQLRKHFLIIKVMLGNEEGSKIAKHCYM